MKLINILEAANIPRNSSGLLGTFESGLLSVRKSGSKTFIKHNSNSVGNVALDFLAIYFQVSLGEVIATRDYVWAEVYDEHTRTVNTSVTIKKKKCKTGLTNQLFVSEASMCKAGLTNQLFVSEASSHKFDSELMQKWYDAHVKLRDANNTVLSITKEQDKPMNTPKPTQEQRLARRIQKAREYGLRYGAGPKMLQRITTSNVEEFYRLEEEHTQKLEAEKAKLVFARDMAKSCLKQEDKKLNNLSIQLRELQGEITQTRRARALQYREANRLSKELLDLQEQE